MKLSKILSKRVLSLFIVGLFVFTAFAVIQSGGGQAQASPSASSSFTFPYQYGTPTVPSDVGAQGIQGPTIPINQIGTISKVGPSGHLGPVNITDPSISFPVTMVTQEVELSNGTLSSSTPAIGALAIFENVTVTYENYSAVTNTNGFANITLPVGWYWFGASENGNVINFTQQIYVSSTPHLIHRFFIDKSYGVLSVNNGGTQVNEWMSLGFFSLPVGIVPLSGQVSFSLYNYTGGGTLLGTAVTLANGTAEFSDMNTAYAYTIEVNGWDQPLTGVKYYTSNESITDITFTSSGFHYFTSLSSAFQSPSGYWSTTGSVSGSTFPAENANVWQLSGPTTITGGITYLSGGIWNAYKVTFINAIVYVNATAGFAGSASFSMNAQNTTFIFLDPVDFFHNVQGGLSIDHSIIIGSGYGSLRYDSAIIVAPPCGYVNDSYIAYSESTDANSNVLMHYYNDNISHMYSSGGWYLGIASGSAFNSDSFFTAVEYSGNNVVFTNSTFINTTVYTPNSLDSGVTFTNDHISNESVGVPFAGGSLLGFDLGSNATHIDMVISYGLNENFTKLAPFPHSGITGFVIGNISESRVSVSWPATTFLIEPLSHTNYYNDIIDLNSTSSQYLYWDSNARYDAGEAQGITVQAEIEGGTNTTFSHDIIYGSGIQASDNTTITHNLFYNSENVQWGGYTVFNYPGTHGANNVISNNTFYGMCLNSTLVNYPFTFGYLGSPSIQAIESQSSTDSFSVTHNTFYGDPIGITTNWLDGYFQNIAYNVFYNNGSAGTDRYLENPYGTDINSATGSSIDNNWFLSLNNMTVPIVSDAKDQTISNNHYFFEPTPYEQDVKLGVIPGVHGDSYTYANLLLGSQNVTSSSGVLISNNTSKAATGNYIWNITPDVFISNGNPLISFSNGLVGGPQPNFIWKGYDYSESVEPTYIQVGVNSSKAPSIGLQFQGIAGALYDIEMFNNGSLISSYQESATSSGVLNATYNPATMPLDPIFYVEYVGSGVVPPPVVTPIVPIVPHVLFGIPYLNVIVLFGGIALASEEFFRTQTKGKEKKYSYTGFPLEIDTSGVMLYIQTFRAW